jgi:threonine/homoserine/homoserine lactone efflux protein
LLSLHSYLIYCGLYAIAIAIPGPGVVAIIARALQSGFRATIPAAIGTAVGDWALMSLSALGLAVLAESMGRLFLVVKLAGATYLFYLGYKYWIAKPESKSSTVVSDSARQGFLSQLTLTLGNPKAIAFFVALLPSVVDLNHLSFVGYGQLSLATFVLIPGITLAYAGLAARARSFITSPRAQKGINKTAAVVMVAAGIGVAAS